MNITSVITSINPPNKCTKSVCDSHLVSSLIVVADKKSQDNYCQNNTFYFDVKAQESSQFSLKNYIPFNHYSRKNLGYLLAIKQGAQYIFDTDDDNFLEEKGENINNIFKTNKFIKSDSSNQFCNIYSYFTDAFIWPRGFPLDELHKKKNLNYLLEGNECDVIQYLANGDTDVDSIYRLIFNKEINFKENESFCLDKNIFSPTNSQSTFFTKKSFPLLYLPITVSFRFTDILRGIVLKNILDLNDMKLGFKSPIVYQDRNKHDYMRDFESEVSMFLNVKKVIEILSCLKKSESIFTDLLNSYLTLYKNGIVKKEEIISCQTWINDLEKA
tara:strand:+ start:856 stop:1842 length:987 start_codon:yes stop_codon:yes gene_type:complete